ncbi:hypothetical protein D3Z39_00760 [Anaerotruncus colihominis]|uniref:Uncharacterized protein n=1 Tax=Anaerotruncus colihominis TaxID=169435 RepID=A0A845RDS8_9FIRM|nr:hypothetical protein [Anaerotruncus colihominis]
MARNATTTVFVNRSAQYMTTIVHMTGIASPIQAIIMHLDMVVTVVKNGRAICGTLFLSPKREDRFKLSSLFYLSQFGFVFPTNHNEWSV